MKTMYKRVIQYLLTTILVLSCFWSHGVNAQDNAIVFGNQITDSLTELNRFKEYKLSVPTAGRISIDFVSYIESSSQISIVDSNYEKVFEKSVYSSSKEPQRYFKWIDLEQGEYTVKIQEYYGDDIGEFKLKINFLSANSNDIEPNNGVEEAQKLDFNKVSNGFLSWNDKIDTYQIILQKAGRVTVDLYSYIDDSTSVQLVDQDDSEIFKTNLSSSSKNPEKYVKQVDLEPGIYYIRVFDNYGSNSGKYQIKTSIEYANNNEKEPNNGVVEAESLSFFKPVTGFLSWNDEIDTYKITLPSTMTIQVNLDSFVDNHTDIEMIDSKNNMIIETSIHGSKKNPAKYNKNLTLSRGEYYLRVQNYWLSQNTGKYILNVTSPNLLPALKVDEVSDASTLVKGKAIKGEEVTLSLAGKQYKVKPNSKGEFSIAIPKQKAGGKINISAKNKYGSQQVTISIVDRTPPGVPTINAVKTSSKTVTGKSEVNATVYVEAGGKVLGSAKVNSNGNYTVKIKAQKEGTNLNVYAKDQAGNKGKSKSIKVKK
ncbi:Ig-like domain-containing protein [Fictibacillus phosphorivorans]|uniref:Ig-like domain-containing protein n=1 Tax=Fictibacillus phosphorivorans TaxID=1221500 RepID=UPI0016425153|nr:Ig-like domain-containing protein [Fictibacillus phosphorivorans]